MKNLKLSALFSLFFFLTACAVSDNFSADAEENKTQILRVQADIMEVYRAAIQEAGVQRWTVISSDSEALFFTAEYSQTLRVWGDTVNVSLSESDGYVIIRVNSNLGQRPNREVVSKYLEALKNRLN